MSKLTAITCVTAKPSESGRDRLLGDGEGLFLRIRPNGTKTWLIDYEFKRQRRKYTIGVFDINGSQGESITDWLEHARLSLTQARAIAGHWKTERRAGHDPVKEWVMMQTEKRAAELAARKALEREAVLPTVSEAIDQFIAKHMSAKRSAAAVKYRLQRLAQILGEKKINAVTRQNVIDALEKIAEGRKVGRAAKQLAGEILIQAKRVWHFAEVREWVAASPIAALSRKDFDAKPVKRDVTLRLEEVAELWRCLDDPIRCKSDPITIAALKILILTGQREREVTDAKWAEFDLLAGTWTIPSNRTKMRKTHLVYLAPQAVQILGDLKSITGKFNHVFASPHRKDQAIYGRSVNNALQTLFKRGALPAVTPCHVHDLRRTLITRLPDLGFESFVGHKIAGHVLPGILAHYNHNEYLSKRQAAMKTWAEQIHFLSSEKKIIPLRQPTAA